MSARVPVYKLPAGLGACRQEPCPPAPGVRAARVPEPGTFWLPLSMAVRRWWISRSRVARPPGSCCRRGGQAAGFWRQGRRSAMVRLQVSRRVGHLVLRAGDGPGRRQPGVPIMALLPAVGWRVNALRLASPAGRSDSSSRVVWCWLNRPAAAGALLALPPEPAVGTRRPSCRPTLGSRCR